MLLDETDGPVEDGEIAKPEEVHLQHAQLLEDLHRVLGDDVLTILGQRDQLGQRPVCDHHTCGVGRAMTVEALEALTDIE